MLWLWILVWILVSTGVVCDINQAPWCDREGQTRFDDPPQAGLRSEVLHCGACGACSNRADIEVYRFTRETLHLDTKRCATYIFFPIVRRHLTQKCMQSLGLSPDCARCWVLNIKCTARRCLAQCLWAQLLNTPDDSLSNPCLACDEKNCGPAFLKCAGANRRTAGIRTDIDRPDSEICDLVL